MRSFFRSLRYLRPYRARLATAVVCVVLISVLWGGGLGMLAPGLKILIDPEGLHGWAWRSGAEDRLSARVFVRDVPVPVRVDGGLASQVIDVVEVAGGGPADRAGLKPGDWLVGLAGSAPMPGNDLARTIAKAEAGAPLRLRVHNHYAGTTRTVELALADPGWKSRALVGVASAVREPADYAGRFPILIWVLAIGVVATVLRDLLRFAQTYLVQTAAYRAVLDIRCDNYNVALRLPTTFYAARGTSDTMSRFIQDTRAISQGQVTLFGHTLVEPGKAAGSIIMALLLSWKLTLVAMIAGPPTLVLIRLLGKVMKRASRKALESWSGMLAVLEETLQGIRVVKAYTMESAERKRFFRVNRRLLAEQDRMARIDAATSPAIEALGVTAGMVAAGAAGYFVLHHTMDPIIFVTWMGCLAAMFDPLRKLARVYNQFQAADSAAARVFELHDREQEKRVPSAPSLAPHRESIEFRGVSFRYPGAEADALREVSLRIVAGEHVAIVGPNGSGKTTLVSLLPRLLDPTAGVVLVDGHDVATVSLRSLRRQIGLVTQDAVLFNATIGENIAYGLRRPTPEAVREAARQAFVEEFVRELPDGYDTMVGQHGATLSGGQKQRITIARAILRDPRILIFDEAMSQIDADSEHKIHRAMDAFIRGRTTLMIAHRFATVLSADRICAMEAGRIVDAGTHEELLERCDVYRHLYRTQFADAAARRPPSGP